MHNEAWYSTYSEGLDVPAEASKGASALLSAAAATTLHQCTSNQTLNACHVLCTANKPAVFTWYLIRVRPQLGSVE